MVVNLKCHILRDMASYVRDVLTFEIQKNVLAFYTWDKTPGSVPQRMHCAPLEGF